MTQSSTTPVAQPAAAPSVQRQFVNFAFFKLDPAFRRLGDHEKIEARSEFLKLFQDRRPGLMCLTYSTVGLRPDCDFLLWRIGQSPDDFQAQTQRLNKSRIGAYLTTPWSFVAMTKRSMYIDKLDPFHTAESRTHIIPGKRKYLFVYPFVKTREWYLLPLERRQEIMDGHIKVGNAFPSVKLNTTYSFGLDDQEFVVAFETDEPKDFLDLVMQLRETEGSKYTLRDTPIFTCVQMPMENVLDQLFWFDRVRPMISDAISNLLPRVTAIRRALHQIPELGYEEIQTASVIRAELDALKIPHVAGGADAPTATIAWIGDVKKPCVALRSDIDALPILEQTGLPYASRHPGRMHACGHDGHIATLLGAATYLKSIEAQLPVCVKFIWQPAEEGGGGADRLVKAGVLDGRIGPKVSAIFGLHGWPGIKVGTLASKPGILLAATDSFSATFVGRGVHGAFPHFGIDPIVTAAEAVLNLQQFVSREMDPTDAAVVTIGMFNAGTATNVIPDVATIAGTARTIVPTSRKKIAESIQRRCAGIAAANNCTLKFLWHAGYPATVNDPATTDYVARIARDAFGPDCYFTAPRPSMGGEDFAYYLEKVPGCFFLVGVEPVNAKGHPPLHSDRYDFTDDALPVGIRMFSDLVMHYRPLSEAT